MLAGILALRLPVALCTVYDPSFPAPLRRRLAILGLALFNDVIAREAFAHGLPLIDLRLVCAEDADFANPIEPSVAGGEKIGRHHRRHGRFRRPLAPLHRAWQRRRIARRPSRLMLPPAPLAHPQRARPRRPGRRRAD